MAFDTENLNAYDFIKSFRASLADRLEERLESGDLFPALQESRETKSFETQEEADKFAASNRGLNPSKPAQGQKSNKWNVSVDVPEKTAGSQSNRAPNTFSKDNLKEGKERIDESVGVGADTMDTDWTAMGEAEKEAVIKLRATAKMLGGDEGAYASGVLMFTFKNRKAVEDFTTELETEEQVDTYEIEAYNEDLAADEDKEYDFSDSLLDTGFEFCVYVYLIPEIVMLPAEELDIEDGFEWDDAEGNGFLTEVRRKIKVNFRGKKRIKMQCSPGFKWNAALKTCRKISGAQVAVMRKAMRRAVLTKKSMGQSFKARVIRKSRKANRFRKSFGLQ